MMQVHEGLRLALLLAGAPVLIWGSTLYSSAVCQIDRAAQLVRPIGNRSDFWPLMLVLGVGQGVVAGLYVRELLQQERQGKVNPTNRPHQPNQPHRTAITTPVANQPTPPPQLGQPLTIATTAQPIPPTLAELFPDLPPTIPRWYEEMKGFPVVLVYGSQGCGKTSFTTGLARAREQRGHRIKVLDPHAAYGQWRGFEVIGPGMEYLSIDRQLQQFAQDVKAEYQRLAAIPHYKPLYKETLVCEEMTNWAAYCPHAGDFFNSCLTDIRKAGKHVIFCSHGRTLGELGGGKGAGKRDAGMMEIELLATVDPLSGEPIPAFRGRLKYPGKEQEPVEIDIDPSLFWPEHDQPHLVPNSQPPPQPTTGQLPTPNPATAPPVDPIAQLNRLLQLDLDQPLSNGIAMSAPNYRFIGGQFDRAQALQLIANLQAAGHNPAQILQSLWRTQPHLPAYRTALAEYQFLTQESPPL